MTARRARTPFVVALAGALVVAGGARAAGAGGERPGGSPGCGIRARTAVHDQAAPGGILLDDKELALLRTLRNQAVMAFRQAG